VLPLDMQEVERRVDHLFARLDRIGEGESHFRAATGVTSWLAVVAAVAFEFTRLRSRRSTIASLPGIGPGRDLPERSNAR
jgi:hypothetical protein